LKNPRSNNHRYEIVQGAIKARGDAPIAQPNFEWHLGRLHVRLNNPNLELTWMVMSEAIQGLRMWGWDVGFITTEFTILDDTVGPVGSGTIGMGYEGAVGNGSAVV